MRKTLWPAICTAAALGLIIVFSVFAQNRAAGPRMKLTTKELMMDMVGRVETYPVYATQLINLANRNARATRPSKVGQMSELIQKFDGKTFHEWKQWYAKRYPDAIDRATDETLAMLEKMKKTMDTIDRQMVRRWISELILAKTYVGLKFQKSILKKIASEHHTTFRLANPAEEARGIDGYIGEKAVSIKPVTYRYQPMMQDTIRVPIIYYEKIRGGINIYYSDF